jgi:hypothetical protein
MGEEGGRVLPNIRHRCHAWLTFAVAVIAAGSAPPASAAREIVAVRAETPPVIDGRLDDACWGEAQATGDFELRQGVADTVTQKTLVRVCYDETNLYVAFECTEDRMDQVSAAIATRDAEEIVESDDCVGFALDTFRDGRSCYAFVASPLGTERDSHASECGRSEDVGWDAVWTVATERLGGGWNAEISIPFGALRFDATSGEVVWGVDFIRSERPHRELSSWSNRNGHLLDPSCYGTLTGLSGIRRSGGIELLPFVMGKYDVAELYEYPLEPSDADWPVHPDAGLDLEYAPSASITVNLTLNPDFAQIEADPNQINLTGDELFLEERRPFFSENADIFQMPLSLLYTRKMEDIVCGAKATGKAGGANFAALYARSDDLPRDEDSVVLTDSLDQELAPVRSDYGALILRQDLFENATLGGLFATRERDDGSSRVGALTGGLDLLEGFRVTGLAARTSNSGGAAGDDARDASAGALAWSYENANSECGGSLTWIEDGFAPETGYVPVDWRGRAGGEGYGSRVQRVDTRAFDQVELGAWAGRFQGLNGDLEEYWVGGEVVPRLRNGTNVGLEVTKGWDGVDYPDAPGNLLCQAYFFTSGASWTGYVGAVEFGDYHDSRYLRGRVGGRIQPVEPFTLEFNWRDVSLRGHEHLDWSVADLRANYRFSGTMFLRAIAQGLSIREVLEVEPDTDEQRYDLYFLYGWEFEPGSMLYVALNHAVEREDREARALDPVFVVKMSYLMSF